mgnify:CR=1 FL=1
MSPTHAELVMLSVALANGGIVRVSGSAKVLNPRPGTLDCVDWRMSGHGVHRISAVRGVPFIQLEENGLRYSIEGLTFEPAEDPARTALRLLLRSGAVVASDELLTTLRGLTGLERRDCPVCGFSHPDYTDDQPCPKGKRSG